MEILNIVRSSLRAILAITFTVAGMSGAAVAAGTSELPNGASSLQETYGDWQVACKVVDDARRCALSQTHVNNKTRQRAYAIEMTATTPDAAKGTLALPFGLDLAKGVSLQIDDTAPGSMLAFSTCLPAGCFVPMRFDADRIAALRKGTNLTARAVATNGKTVAMPLSLKGFSAALDRITQIMK